MKDEYRRQATARDPATQLRLPPDLMKEIDRAARRNGRTRNCELLERIATSVEEQQQSADAA